jgi:hypothetical protein
MANEITIQAKLSAAKNGAGISNATTTKTQTIENALAGPRVNGLQSVGTSKEAVALADTDTTKQYMVLLRNTDPTNYVTVYGRPDATPNDCAVGIMLPGESWGPVRMPALTGGYPLLYVKADTAACQVDVQVTEAGNPLA